jgi:hypothetical protein
MGWDAFGLPAEQYAIDTGTHPSETTKRNINRFREQLKARACLRFQRGQQAAHLLPPAAVPGVFIRLGARGGHVRRDVLPVDTGEHNNLRSWIAR